VSPREESAVEVTIPAVSPTMHRPGRGTLIFGLVLFIAGALLVTMAGGLLPTDLTVPREVVMMPGIGMLAFGLYLLVRGGTGLLGERRRARLRARHPDEPWRSDHDWSPEGARERSYADAGATLVIAGFCFLFLAPFNWMAFLGPERHWLFAIVVGLFDLLTVVAPLAFAVYQLGHALRYGGGFVRFDRFPFFLGETLAVRLGSDRPVGKYSRLVVTLRCLEIRGTSDPKCYQRYLATRELPAGVLAPGIEVEATFELPTGDHASQLAGQEPRFWTIKMRATTTGIDFEAELLVPVYAKPRRP
jgi:hypothetical protein